LLDFFKTVDHIDVQEVLMARASVRDMIFEAGQAEFHEHGYTATGIAAITARAAAHKGSFYNHFSSKEELAVETLRAYGAAQRLDLLENRELGALDRLRTHFAFIAGTIGGAPVINGCMVANFAAESSDETPLIRAQIADVYRIWSELIADNLAEAAETAGVAGFDAPGVAWTLLDAYEGAAVRARATRSAAPLENFLQTTLPLMLAPVSGAA
jgi:TetR/AcrR family transcriptional regulator, transcriptional repressor for nem operon